MTPGNSHSTTGVASASANAAAYAPLRQPIFRAPWLASLVSNLGTWLQNVGAGWLMTGLTPSPVLVALVQAATTLPVFLLALPAGALADVIDVAACCSPPRGGCSWPRRRLPRSRPPAS
jgi:hypothetical protein